jgi:hypothetical protein
MKIIISEQKKKTGPSCWTIVSDKVAGGTRGQSLIFVSIVTFTDADVGSFKTETKKRYSIDLVTQEVVKRTDGLVKSSGNCNDITSKHIAS